MHRSFVVFICAAGALVAGCGGSDSKDSGTTAETPAATTAAATSEATEAASPSSSGGALTKPGTELSQGDVAHVTLKPFSTDVNEKRRYPLDVVVEKIEKGTLDDFKNIELDDKQKDSTPYYVTVKITSTGDKSFKTKTDDPDVRFDGVDDRGQEQGSVTFFGTFDRCDDKQAPDPMKPGDSYESCITYLVPGGGTIEAEQWSGSDEYITDPVVWK